MLHAWKSESVIIAVLVHMATPRTLVVGYLWLFCVFEANSDINFVSHDAEDSILSNMDCACDRASSEDWEVSVPFGYNNESVPTSLDGNGRSVPLKVYFTAIVQTVSPIMASETEFRVNMKFILKWTDTRLRICNDNETASEGSRVSILPVNTLDLLWLPNPFIVNAKYAEIKRLHRKLIGITVSTSGLVTLSFVMNATVDCAMNFKWFPLDAQTCPMHIESLSYDNSYVDYNWLPNHPFQILPRRLLQFEVESSQFHYSKTLVYREYIGRHFTRITVYFRFNRLLGSHLLQTFVPCSLIVILSWFNFWLELDVTSARASLLMTAMLTLVMQYGGLRAELPPVAYVKAVDIWMFGCMFFIFAAMAEFVVVKVIYSLTERIRKENSVKAITPSYKSYEQDTGTLIFLPSHFIQSLDFSNEPYYQPVLLTTTPPSYKKKRLGSVVLSGRSIATSHLPQVHFYMFGLRIPLVWNDSEEETLSNTSSSSSSSPPTPQTYVLWRHIDIISRKVFPILFLTFSICYWITLIVFSTLDTTDTF